MHQVTDEMAGGHWMAAGYLGAKFLSQRLLPMWQVPGQVLSQPGGLKGMEKRGVMAELLGDPNHPSSETGILGNTLWGLQGTRLPEWIRALVDPSLWNTLPQETQRLRLPLPGMDWRGAAEGMFARPVELTPEGKVRY
jgi:hypothetical protein